MEVNRPDRRVRRHKGKSDLVDAEAAARAVQSGRATGEPKTYDGNVEMLRVLRLTRRSAQKTVNQTGNQLLAVIRELDPHVARLVKATVPTLLERQGVGPQTAAALLVTAGDNPDRLKGEGAFAHRTGIAPLPASDLQGFARQPGPAQRPSPRAP